MAAVVKAVQSVVTEVSDVIHDFGIPSGGGGGGGGILGFVGDVISGAGNALKDVGDFVVNKIIEPTAKVVEKTIESAINDPIGTIAKVAAVATGNAELLPLINAADAAAHGASAEDILKSAAVSYVAGEATQGIGQSVGNATGSALAANAAQGAASSLLQGKDPLTGAINAGFNYEVNDLAKSGLTALNTPTPNADNLNVSPSDQVGGGSSADYSLASGNTQGIKIPSSITDSGSTDITSPIDYFGGIRGGIDQLNFGYPSLITNYGSPIDTSPENYSLSSNVTPKTMGMSIDPWTGGAKDVGYSPVDYSLANPNDLTGGLGLQMPNSLGIKAMGGAQGLTADVTNPDGSTGVVGGLGFTPTGASPVLGDPSSFINNPDVTGQPVMATDPAYYGVSIPRLTTKGLIDTSTPLHSTSQSFSGASAPKSTYATPLDSAQAAESYLTSGGATDAAGLAQLKQLFPSLTPDMAKILMERVGVTPAMLMTAVNQQSGETPQNDDLSAVSLANIGQPDEYLQYAQGGNVSKTHRPEFITGKTGHYAQGRGTGQSDDIPAVLHDGDYVVDADTVAAFGDGSSKAGASALEQFRRSIPEHRSGGGQPIPAQIADGEYVLPAGFVTSLGKGSNKHGAKMLDAMREQIRAHKRSAPDTKIPPKARSPLQYMHEAMKG